MKLPSKGSPIVVDGYGRGLFVGASFPEDGDHVILMKFEGRGLDEGYGRGIIAVPRDEFEEKRRYPEQMAANETVSTEKRDAILAERRAAAEGDGE